MANNAPGNLNTPHQSGVRRKMEREMKDYLQVIKPSVRRLRAYTLTPEVARIKINQNENPFDLPQAIKEEALRRWSERAWSRYPEFVPQALHDRIAEFSGWTSNGVLAGNGSNELLQGLLAVTLGEGRKILLSEPTFAIYRQIANVQSASILSVPLTAAYQHDAARLKDVIEEHQPEVTIICSPNNPTGCVIEDSKLIALLEAANGLIVVDEAYFEFSEHSVVPLLHAYTNLVVTRTFSKAMAGAALRIGYLLAAPELTREINKAILPYNLNMFSQMVAQVALEMYDAELHPLVELLIAERERLYERLRRIEGINPIASHANFMIVELALEPRHVFRQLAERDILVRDVSGYPMLGRALRMSVGTPEENDKLLGALAEVIIDQRVVGAGVN
jgi:histidinol-phosphate aminotransferase